MLGKERRARKENGDHVYKERVAGLCQLRGLFSQSVLLGERGLVGQQGGHEARHLSLAVAGEPVRFPSALRLLASQMFFFPSKNGDGGAGLGERETERGQGQISFFRFHDFPFFSIFFSLFFLSFYLSLVT
ncbi:hypothetical protein B0T26DRAFT_686155, partial [Lasiosphaeria miniovina]